MGKAFHKAPPTLDRFSMCSEFKIADLISEFFVLRFKVELDPTDMMFRGIC